MTESVDGRQHAVNDVGLGGRPRRTPEGEEFTRLVVSIAGLGGRITEIGEQLAGQSGATLARWVVLDMAMDAPATVAQIARSRGMARQSVQRIADLLVTEGLATYQDNPGHKRAKLLQPTPEGRRIVTDISGSQKTWADALGDRVGTTAMRRAQTLIDTIRAELDHPLGP